MRGIKVSLSGVRFSYGDHPVLHGVDLTVEPGGFTGLMGPNGSGKSTLVKLIAGIERAAAGSLRVDGREVEALHRRQLARLVAVVPQEMVFSFPFRVFEFVLMGRYPHHDFLSWESQEDLDIAERYMRATDTWRLRDRSLLGLSGGERQRVVLASALAQQPALLILDEPTSSLDLHYQVEIYRILSELNQTEGITILTVTHDLNLGAQFCRRLAVLVEGKIVAEGAPEQILTADIIRSHYGVEVYAAVNPHTGSPFILPIRAVRAEDES